MLEILNKIMLKQRSKLQQRASIISGCRNWNLFVFFVQILENLRWYEAEACVPFTDNNDSAIIIGVIVVIIVVIVVIICSVICDCVSSLSCKCTKVTVH